MLFITDLDGTALGGHQPYAVFPHIFGKFLDRLTASGWDWGINTTWDINGQWELVKSSKINSTPSFMMAEFGLRLASVRNGKPEFIQPYTQNMEKRLCEIIKRKLNRVIREITAGFSCDRLMFYGHYLDLTLSVYEKLDSFKSFVDRLMQDEELTCSLEDRRFTLRPAFLSKASPFYELHLSPDQVIIAGDEDSDMAMMQPHIAKYYICPANATLAVKEHVRKYHGEVGDLPYGEGVIKAFEKLANRKNWNYEF